MFSEERQKIILSLVNQNGSVKISEIEKKLDVSKITAWRDLKTLEEKGLIEKVYGGAIKKTPSIFRLEPSFNEKLLIANKEKNQIAKYAVEHFVHNSDIIILSGGSTVMRMIPYLVKKEKITILTNGVKTVSLASEVLPKIEIYSCGGMVRKESFTFVGHQAETFFKGYNADCIFLSGTGFTLEEGLMDPNAMDMQVKRAMCNSTKKKIILLDSSKFNKMSLVSTLKLDEIDLIITDQNAPKDYIKELTDFGLEVIIAIEEK